MQRREQLLLGSLLAVVVIWQGGSMLFSAIMEPFHIRSDNLARLNKSVSDKSDELINLKRAMKSIADAKAISLPPDVSGKSKRYDALNAQRLYQQWLTDLAELCDFEGTKITPARTIAKGDIYVQVVVKLEASPKYSQLVRFLDQFYRTNLLHRITNLHIVAKEFELDPYLTVTLDAEGLALVDVPPRATLFPQSELAADLTEHGTQLQIAPSADFPKKPGFRIRIRREFLNVTAIEGDKWTVERGIDQTLSAAYLEETVVELVQQKPGQTERSTDALREMIAANIFLKPAPPHHMKLSPINEKGFVIGRPVDFTITAIGYDAARGKPEFSVVGTPPTGLRLDKSGRVSWRPANDIKPDKYPLTVEVRHPSAPQGKMTETLMIRLRDANSSPKFSNAKPPVVYLNRGWNFKPEISVADSPTAKFTWKLGDRPPEGLKIDSKTGEMKWSPSDAVPLGELNVPIIVTDSDTPPTSTTLMLKVDVQDDDASFTRLDGIFIVGEKRRAFLFDPSKNRKTELHEGDDFAVADLIGVVKQINKKYIVLIMGDREIRVDVGQSLREAKTKSDELFAGKYD